MFDFPSAGAGAWNGSAAPYATDWDCSPSGRITQITELVLPAAQVSDESQLTRAFTYGNAAHAHAHAVTGVEVTDNRTDPNPGPGPQVVDTSVFDYDAAGRQTLRVVDGVTETLTWDVSSNLVKTVVDDGTGQTTWTYLYDASGQRWAKIETPTDTESTPQATVYLGDTEITDSDTSVNDATADVAAVRYFTFGGATVAMEQAVEVEPFEPSDPVPFFFLFGDYQGSAQVVMPDVRDETTGAYDLAASAGAVLRNAYTPYGATRAVGFGAGAADEDDALFERTWLSQVADETTATLGTGLTYLNARYYDPAGSRFLSPDPLLDVLDPKTLDPYRYADNNPIMFTDATGLMPEWLRSVGGFAVGMFEAATYAPREAMRPAICIGVRGWDACYEEAKQEAQAKREFAKGLFVDYVATGVSANAVITGDRSNGDHMAQNSAVLRKYTYGPMVDAYDSGDPYSGGKMFGEFWFTAMETTALAGVGGLSSTRAALPDEVLGPPTARGGVYALREAITGKVLRTGRTKDLDSRRGDHARDPDLENLRFTTLYRTDDLWTQRGLEKIAYDSHPTSWRHNGGFNKIRPIAPKNAELPNYMKAAMDYMSRYGGG